MPLWVLPTNFSYLQKPSQSSQIIPCPTVKSSLFPLSDTFLHELSAVEGHASVCFQDRWYTNPPDLLTKPFFSQKPSTCPFIPGHIASLSYASFPRCHPINRVLPREQIATRFGSAAPTHCYQNAMFLERGCFMLLLFSSKNGWQPDSKMILCVIDFVFFPYALNNSCFS